MSEALFAPELGFSRDIFSQRYGFTEDETWEQFAWRVAAQMALPEEPSKVEKYKKRFFDIIAPNYFIPAGRINYGSGRPNPALLNCFVLSDNIDSKQGWGKLLHDVIVTSMAGGGCGVDYSDIRPEGAEIKGHRGICSGPLSLMKVVDAAAKVVIAGGGRRAAFMNSLDLDHSDVLKFLDAKLEKGELSTANISVRSLRTTEFIEAVKGDLDWELSWKNKYKFTIKAKMLWDKIVKNAWKSGEPGFLNLELARKESPSSYHSEIVGSNPCGEQFLPVYGNCCLGHLVLPRFVKGGKVDWPLMGSTIRMGVRFLDNVLDVNAYPLPEQKEQALRERRIGLGVTGFSDFLTMLGVRYGSDEGNEITDKLFRFISKQAYDSSVFLAAEKGAFPECKPELHVKTGFVKRLTPKIKSMILEHGIRNTAILSIAPTGTTSIVSNNCSGGLEPMFAPAYWRNFFEDKVRKSTLCFHPLFAEALKKGEDISHFTPASEISVRQHLEVQKIAQKHIDGAVSKTVCLPKDYPVSELSDIWLEYLPFLKGTTFYREGSRNFIDPDTGKELPPPLVAIPVDEAIELYHKQKEEIKAESAPVNDCPKGVCEI